MNLNNPNVQAIITELQKLKNEIPEPLKQKLQVYSSVLTSEVIEELHNHNPNIDTELLQKIIDSAKNTVEYDPKINKIKAVKSGMENFFTLILTFVVYYFLKKYVPAGLITDDLQAIITGFISMGIGALMNAIYKAWDNKRKILKKIGLSNG
jgi:hypothetical protein